jgi:hypothetical protein
MRLRIVLRETGRKDKRWSRLAPDRDQWVGVVYMKLVFGFHKTLFHE